MSRKSGASQDIENYKHDAAKRTMIPTAEQQGFVEEDEARPKKLRYPRNPDLDPQIVWRGKDAEDERDLYVDAPPVYIQEKIHPRVIVERLKRDTAARAEAKSEIPDLFADFNGRPENPEARTEFYQHEQNWQNRMILGDALMVMASLAERENLRGKVQCIYMDPPYGIKFNSNWQATTGSRDVKDGNAAHVSREPEVIRAFRDTWKDEVNTYLSYLRDRLTIARDLLTDSGSIFVQIGDENVHRVRALMDEVFGAGNFISLISFRTTTGLGEKFLDKSADYLIWYCRDIATVKYRELYQEKSLSDDVGGRYRLLQETDGRRRSIDADERAERMASGKIKGVFRRDNLTSQSGGESTSFDVRFQGRAFQPGKNFWKSNADGLSRLAKANRLSSPTKNSVQYVRFLNDFSAAKYANVWTDTQTGAFTEEKTYVVQTNTKVVARCVLMTTDPGDLVLDPTCGSGTSAYVAEEWGRRWITIDTSRVSLTLARARIMGARYPFYLLRDSNAGLAKDAELTGLAPQPDRLTEVQKESHKPDVSLGFVYRRVPHVQLRDIASNAEIDIIWDRLTPSVQEALRVLNDCLKGHQESFEINVGGRSGQLLDFTQASQVKLPSGELAPTDGFMEWEVPRSPVTPWPLEQQKLHEAAKAFDRAGKAIARLKADDALAALNKARNQKWTHETLPQLPESNWPKSAEDALTAFWKAWLDRQTEIDRSIELVGRRNAEQLFDRPFEDPKITRVAGPFTVESLSPYRVIPSDDDPRILDMLRDDQEELPHRMVPKEQTDFARVVMEHLKTAGVQNTKKDERLKFDSIEPWPGKGYVAFDGRYEERGVTRRAAIAVGPEYDAVGYEFVRRAALEARDVFDILIICGFQFGPEVDDSMLNFGRLKVLKARMNQDIRMGDKLKNTGAGNLFVVFGEPDIEVRDLGGGLIQVEILGVDIFDPTTGEVKSSDDPAEDIACWFIDDDYDQESFFVRHAYFLGGAADEPYKALKRSLKSEIDEEAWASLRRTISHPFARPDRGQICVKVINHFGDEVQKVFSIAPSTIVPFKQPTSSEDRAPSTV